MKSVTDFDNYAEISFQNGSKLHVWFFTDDAFAKKSIIIAAEKICPIATTKLKNISLN